MSVLSGLAGYLGLFALLAASMTLAARGVGRLVGVPRFRWFDSKPASTDWWREAAVRLAAMVAPWCLSVLLFFVQVAFVGSVAARGGTYVEVLEGPAKAAGMRTGDRVVRIGAETVSTWEQMRAVVSRQTEPVDVEIERAGKEQVLHVTPRDGRIAVSVQMVSEKVATTTAFGRALGMPWQVVSSAAKSFVAMATQREKPELVGPVHIVQETGKAGPDGMLWLLAALAAYLGPLLSGVVLFELVTGVVFRSTYPEAAAGSGRGFRLARLLQALLLSTSAYLLALPLFVLIQSGGSPAALLLVWIMPAYLAAYPLIAIAGTELWPRPVVVLCLIFGPIVPCALLAASVALLVGLKRALVAEGFRFGWLRSEPPAPAAT